MKASLGLYAHQLNDRDFAFARQCGATQIVVHLVDYFHGLDNQERENQPVGGSSGWGYAGKNGHLWRPDELKRLVTRARAHELEVVAIENFDPIDWYDVLLAGPRREEQLEKLRQIVRNVGDAEIPMIGYNFSIAGVASRVSGRFARGGAVSVGMDGIDQTPIPKGMVWNMVYDAETAETALFEGDVEPTVSEEALWSRLSYFLETLLPTAESAGVTLAAHPDDPPASEVRSQPRLVWTPELYDRLLDIYDSPNNKLEFCLGTLAEMPDHDIYQTLRHYLERNAIGYIHLRNVRGTVPKYRETFIDDGKIDVWRVVEILKEHQYDGPILPDHTPQMSCDAPWHAGMAYAMGYLNALLL